MPQKTMKPPTGGNDVTEVKNWSGVNKGSYFWLRSLDCTVGTKRPVMILQILLIVASSGFCAHGDQHRLFQDLIESKPYIRELRPVINQSTVTTVKFGISPRQIVKMDQPSQVLESNVWFFVRWQDELLTWTPINYGGVKEIVIPSRNIWVPDITLYNNADEKYRAENLNQGLVKVTYNGSVSLDVPGIIRSTCRLDVTYFPFDEQFCTLKFGSWAYSGAQLDLWNLSDMGDMGFYQDNGEWDLLAVPVDRNVVEYFDEKIPYVDLDFVLHLKRRSMFYIINLLLPCMMITSLTLLDFNLPCESGEKVTLGITIILSLTVFLLLVVEQMPPTSYSFPWIGRYFSATLMLVCLSMVMTVTVLNVHYAHDRYVSPPKWLSKLAFDWLKMFTSKRHRRRPCNQKTARPADKNNFDIPICGETPKNCNENSSLLKNVSPNSYKIHVNALCEMNELSCNACAAHSCSAGHQKRSNCSHVTRKSSNSGSSFATHTPPSTLTLATRPSPYHMPVSPGRLCPGNAASNFVGLPPSVDEEKCDVFTLNGNEDIQESNLHENDTNSQCIMMYLDDIDKQVKYLITKTKEEHEANLRQKEWREISRILDRTFLWVFIFISFASTGIALGKSTRVF